MKKRYAVIILTAVLLFTCSCSKNGGNIADESDLNSTISDTTGNSLLSEETTENDNAQRALNAKAEDYVTEFYGEDCTYKSSYGTEYTYSYHVPQIEIDSSDAYDINAEIKMNYAGVADDCVKEIENNAEPECLDIKYESYLNGNILSLVIGSHYNDEYYDGYSVYNFDVATGEQVDNSALLAYANVNEERYLCALRYEAARCYDENNYPSSNENETKNVMGYFQERRSWTVSNLNVNMNQTAYLDSDGMLNTIMPIGSCGYRPSLYNKLKLDLNKADKVEKTAELDGIVSVALKGKELSVKLVESEKSRQLLSDCGDESPYGKEIVVHGLYSDYTDVFCGLVGAQERPYVFLLTDEGRVEYVDILSGLESGYVCVCGPLLGLDKVKTFDYGNVGVVLDNGYIDKLDMHIEREKNMMRNRFKGDWIADRIVKTEGSGSYRELSTACIGEDGRFSMYTSLVDVGLELNFSGTLTYLGMNDDGAVYYYSIADDESKTDLHSGAVAISTEYVNTETEYLCMLYVKELSGTGMFSTTMGETTALTEAVG